MQKYVVLFFTFFLSFFSFALPQPDLIKETLSAQKQCGRFVRFDEQNLYNGFGQYRRNFDEPRLPLPGRVRVTNFETKNQIELNTKDAAIDLISLGHQIYILTYSGIEEWDLSTQKRVSIHSTHRRSGLLEYMQHPQGFARFQNKLIIAHGRLGVSFFDLESKKLTNAYSLIDRQLPYESMATAVSIQGDIAYVVMDNFHVTNPGDGIQIFRGIVMIDMKTEKVIAELDGLDPGADGLLTDEQNLILSFAGFPIWHYKIADFKNAKKLPEPQARLWRFPLKGHPVGLASMDSQNYYTCFLKAPNSPGENGGRSVNIPMTLNRTQMRLNNHSANSSEKILRTIQFSQSQIVANYTWEQGSDTESESILRLQWMDLKTQKPIDPYKFEVSIEMPSMGHGSAPTQIQRVLDLNGKAIPGLYDVTSLYFIMSGVWEVKISLQRAENQITENTSLEIEIP